MTTHTVSTPNALTAALRDADPGDVIVCAPGEYGHLEIERSIAMTGLVVRSADPSNPARFTSIEWTSAAQGVRLAGVHVEGSARYTVQMSGWLNALLDSEVQAHFSGGKAIYVLGADDCEIGSCVVGGGEDHVHVSSCSRLWIRNNRFTGRMTPEADSHIDGIQFRGGGTGHRVIGNLILADTHPGMQGIFIDDGMYTDFLAEQNIVAVGKAQGIYFGSDSAGSSGLARNNTIIGLDNPHEETLIKGFAQEGNLMVDENNFSQLFQGRYGFGMTINDLRPVPGSRAETEGAAIRIMELLDGTPPPETEPPEPPMEDTIEIVAVTIAATAMGEVAIVDGKIRYTPAAGYSGEAFGTYTIRDAGGSESTAAWSGLVEAPVNPPPLATDDVDAFSVAFGTPFVTIDVMANDQADMPVA